MAELSGAPPGCMRHHAQQHVGMSRARQRIDIGSEALVFIVIEGRGHLGPDDDGGRPGSLEQRAAQGQSHLVALHLVERCGGPLLGFGDVRLVEERRLAPAGGGRQIGQKPQKRQHHQPQQFQPRPSQHGQGQPGGHHHEHERDSVHAGNRRQAQRIAHIDAGIAQRQPGEAQRAVRHFHGHPKRGHRRNGPPAPHQDAGQPGEHAHVQRLGEAEQQEDGPAGRVAHAAVIGQHELNPVADAEPVDHAGHPAPQKAAQRARLARGGYQQRRQRHGGEPDQVELRKRQDQQHRRKQRQGCVQHRDRRASSLTSSAM